MNPKLQTDMNSPTPKRKQPLLQSNGDKRDRDNTDLRRRRIGEVAGGATADCAVVCCCIPVAIINLLILAVYKVPAGLGKKVWRKKKKKRLLKKQRRMNEDGKDEVREKRNGGSSDGSDGSGMFGDDGVTTAVDFDDQVMWDDLYGTGFWRIPSQKEDTVVEFELD